MSQKTALIITYEAAHNVNHAFLNSWIRMATRNKCLYKSKDALHFYISILLCFSKRSVIRFLIFGQSILPNYTHFILKIQNTEPQTLFTTSFKS